MRRLLRYGGLGAAIVIMLLSGSRQGLAWGPEAHRVIALLADRVLQQSDPAARDKVRALLATDQESRLTRTDIASEATWADVLRDKSPEARSATAAWHAVRLKKDNPDLAAACFGRKPLPAGYPASRGPQDNCVVDKIEQFWKELQEADTLPGERLAALQFLLNLTGDLHDPLLAIDFGDQGGRCIALQIGAGKEPVRLLTYWQNTLAAEVIGRDPASAATRLAAAVAPAQAQQWAQGDPEAWARDSYDVAKAVTYGFAAESPAGKHRFPAQAGEPDPCGGEVNVYKAGPDYETKALAAVKQQLAKAGIRLARILRESFK
jgi:hypothetical protein